MRVERKTKCADLTSTYTDTHTPVNSQGSNEKKSSTIFKLKIIEKFKKNTRNFGPFKNQQQKYIKMRLI